MIYAAFLRGIGPSNTNMRNDKLRAVFEELGLKNVRSIISSGNILFESDELDTPKLEHGIESALQAKLSIKSAAIIRDHEELATLSAAKPFGERTHGRQTYLTVTFLKHSLPKDTPQAPATTPDKASKILEIDTKTRAICAVTDTTLAKTPDFMLWLEKQFGKDITTRTWLTVQRVLKKMEG